MGHFYFVRHGQTVWNVEKNICGATDVALTEKGHQQAIETGNKFIEQGLAADEILYSPLSRAADTARHISEITGIPARPEHRLIEQNFGRYEATPHDGREFYEAKKDFASRYGTGESMLQVAQRIYDLLDDLKTQPDKTYILVAHNGIARKRGLDAELLSMAAMLHDLYAYKSGSYDDHAHKGAELASEVLGKLNLTTPEETELICSAIYHHDDKHVVDSPADEALKDADVIHHCMNDLSKPVKEKERVRFGSLCAEFGMEGV